MSVTVSVCVYVSERERVCVYVHICVLYLCGGRCNSRATTFDNVGIIYWKTRGPEADSFEQAWRDTQNASNLIVIFIIPVDMHAS